MALNKFMHPRNPYKTPPNFKELAIQFPRFRRVIHQDLAGKIHLDFNNQEAVRTLTEILFLKDFQLDVTIPENCLVPTLPSRLNYLLWIEDLLSLLTDDGEVVGIDIGAGASAVYPLLGAKHCGWRFVATESDSINYKAASENITKNHLDNKISINKTEDDEIFENLFANNDQVYTFCMCNPPFYTVNKQFEDGGVGTESEMKTSGGEVEFVKKMISESVENPDKVKIFTVLLGHKSSLSPLKQCLSSAQVTSLVTTEFCQGKTMRWGLAWTFISGLDLRHVFNTKSNKDKQKAFTTTIDKPDTIAQSDYNARTIFSRIKMWLEGINVELLSNKESKFMYSGKVKAKEKTWQNQRRLKREEKRKRNNIDDEVNDNKKQKLVEEGKFTELLDDDKSCVADSNLSDALNQEVLGSLKKSARNENTVDDKGDEDNVKTEHFVLICDLTVKWSGGKVVLELCYRQGDAGRDGVHQLCQFIKNKFASV